MPPQTPRTSLRPNEHRTSTLRQQFSASKICKIYEEVCGSCNRFIYYVDFHVGATNGHLPASPVQIIRRKAINPCHYCSTEKWRRLNKPCDDSTCGILHGMKCRACGKNNTALNEVVFCARAALRHHKHMISNELADTLEALRTLKEEVVLEWAVMRLKYLGPELPGSL